MSSIRAPRASMEAPRTAQTGPGEERGATSRHGELGGAELLFADVRLRYLLIGEARHRVITRVFGIPRSDQSLLVTTILIGAGAAVVRDAVARPWPRLAGSDAAIGGALLNAMLRGIAGPPSQGMPVAGGLVVFALLSRSLRPAMAGSAREVRALAREVGAAFGARYGHRSAGVAVDR